MKKVVYLTRFHKEAQGHGGNHRCYQISQDLEEAFPDSIEIISLTDTFIQKRTNLSGYQKVIGQRAHLINLILHRDIKSQDLLDSIRVLEGKKLNLFGEVPIEDYENYVNQNGKPELCIVESAKFLPVIKFNQENQIKTLFCPHNIDSFDFLAHQLTNATSRAKLALNFMAELEALAACDESLMISNVETNLVKGLGFLTSYYPYLPAGEIRDRMLRIRSYRESKQTDPRLFLMFGTLFHETTYESFRWLLKNVREHPLPKDIKILVCGRGGEKLIQEFSDTPGVEVRGKMDQKELDDLMSHVTGVLVPQRSGFGAVTRIPELACAGIPTVASEHTLAAINPPPGINFVPDEYGIWKNALNDIVDNSESNTLQEYEAWEKNQPRPLKNTIERIITK